MEPECLFLSVVESIQGRNASCQNPICMAWDTHPLRPKPIWPRSSCTSGLTSIL